MKIQINTDKNVEGNERQETYFSGELHALKFILPTRMAISLVQMTRNVL
jgi:hypothetical protein